MKERVCGHKKLMGCGLVCDVVVGGELEQRGVVPGGSERGVLSMDKRCEREWTVMACWTDGTDDMFLVTAVPFQCSWNSS